MKNSTQQYSLEILVNGKPVKEFFHKGDYFVEGRKGSSFELKITNHSYSRILAVPSVDGLSVMDGKPASEESNGYVINGYGTLTIPGWRLDNDSVAKFVFQGKEKSYAELTGESGNQGVIGLMIFTEKSTFLQGIYPTSIWNNNTTTFGPLLRSASYNATNSIQTYSANVASAKATTDTQDSQVENELGTGFGKKEEHSVVSVSFNKDTSSKVMLAVYYDTRKGLEKRGIKVVYPKKQVTAKPNPFPAQGCLPPKGWKG